MNCRKILAALIIAVTLLSGATAPRALAAVHTHGHVNLDHSKLNQSDAGFLDNTNGGAVAGYTTPGWYCIAWDPSGFGHWYVVYGPSSTQLTDQFCSAY